FVVDQDFGSQAGGAEAWQRRDIHRDDGDLRRWIVGECGIAGDRLLCDRDATIFVDTDMGFSAAAATAGVVVANVMRFVKDFSRRNFIAGMTDDDRNRRYIAFVGLARKNCLKGIWDLFTFIVFGC